jgi:nucleoside 2-deoxyribosyltransferase
VYKVYLAGSWARKDELCGMVPTFLKYGISVHSRWLWESAPAAASLTDVSQEYREYSAQVDIDDVATCDALILFSNGYGAEVKGGGRFFEAGYAYALSKPIITVGDREMIFQYLPEDELMYQVPDVYGAISLIGNWQLEIAQDEEREKTRASTIAYWKAEEAFQGSGKREVL